MADGAGAVSGTNIQAGRDVTIVGAGSVINRNRGLVVAITIGLCAIGSGIAYLVIHSQHTNLDAPGIRAHLVESSERKRDKDLVAAALAQTSTERERLREEAEKANLARKARIDDLVDSFVTIDAKTETTSVFREMSRILSEEGVDAALAYVDKRRADVLDRIQSRIASEHEQNRIDLQPLLKAADLRSAKGEYDTARSSYRHLLSLEPNWPDALEAFTWFLIDQSAQYRSHGTIKAAFTDAQEALAQTQLLLGQNESNPRAQRVLSAALNANADMLSVRRQPGDADQALLYYTRSLDVSEGLLKSSPNSVQAADDLSITLVRLADFLGGRGQPGDADQALLYYTRSLNIGEGLLKNNPGSNLAARDVSITLGTLGRFLRARGRPGDYEQALIYYTRSLTISEELLKKDPGSSLAAHDASVDLNRLGDFLGSRGQPRDSEQALKYYTRALEICEGILKNDPGSNLAARDVSIALDNLGDFLSARSQPGDSEQALVYYIRSLKICEGLLQSNADSGEAARDVSVITGKLGAFLVRRQQPGDADQAFIYYKRDLEIGEGLLKSNPGSGEAARDVSIVLENLGDLLSARGQPGDADQAFVYYTRSLDIGDGLLKRNPGSSQAERDDCSALTRLGVFLSRRGRTGDADQALRYYRRALEISEELLKTNPGSGEAARYVSIALEDLGDFLSPRGQPGDADEAINDYRRSLEICDGLLQTNPGSGLATRDDFVALIKLGDFINSRDQSGDADEALKYYSRGLEICETRLKGDPGSGEVARDMSVALDKLGNLLRVRNNVGDADQALIYFTRDLEISQGLRKNNPGSAQAARDVAVTLNELGDLLSERGHTGDADQALQCYTRSLEISEELLKADPGSGQAARDVSVVLGELGNLLRARGKVGDADQEIKYYTRNLEISEGLLKSNPGSSREERDVSVALGKVANLLRARGNVGDADQVLLYYNRDLEISERLLKESPGSGQASRNVAVILHYLGDFLRKRGQPEDSDQALKYYTRSLELCDGLLKSNPSSDRAKHDDYAALISLGKFFAARGQDEESRSYFQRANDLKNNGNTDGTGVPHP